MEPVTQEGFFPVSFFDKLTIDMILCSEVKEETDDDDVRQVNSPGDMDKTLAALEAIPKCLNWGQIFSLSMRHVNVWPPPCGTETSILTGSRMFEKIPKSPFMCFL